MRPSFIVEELHVAPAILILARRVVLLVIWVVEPYRLMGKKRLGKTLAQFGPGAKLLNLGLETWTG